MSKIVEFIKKRKSGLIHLGVSLLLLLVAAGIGIFLGLKKTNGLDRYINEAYEYYQDSNWVALYKYSENKGDDFINEYFFEVMAEAAYGEVDKSKLSLGDVTEDDGKATAELKYKDSDDKEVTWSVEFLEKPEKNYVIFNQWKLNIDSFIAQDSKLTVPSGFQVYVDGVELTEDNSTKTDNTEQETVTFTIPKIFKGEHVIYVKKDLIEVFEETVQWSENNSEYVLDTSKLQLVQAEQEKIKTSSEEIVQLMYKAVFEELGTEELGSYIVQDEGVKEKMQAVYDSILVAITPDDGSTLNSISITSFTENQVQLDYPSKANVTLTFDCTFKARGPRDYAAGIREIYEGSTSSTITLHFIQDGENWLCDNLDMQCIDYSKPEEPEEETE